MFENLFAEEINRLGIKLPFNKLLFCSIIGSCALSSLIILLPNPDFTLKLLFSLCTLVLPPSLAYFILDYLKAAKQKRIEAELPDLLFQIASFPKNTPLEKIIESIQDDNSSVSKEFSRAHNLIRTGFPIKTALTQIALQNESVLLKRAISLMLQTYEAGADMAGPLNAIAQDIYEMQSLQQENAAAQSMQKYTLIGGVAIFIPLILALLLGVVGNFGAADNSIFQPSADKTLLPSLLVSIQIYLFILSVIASIFIAMQEGKLKKAALYFCLLFPSSLLVFNILKSMSFI